jgi:hypothetical protein
MMKFEWNEEPEADMVLEYMQKLGLPLTRATYLDFNYPVGVPAPLPAEIAASVPRWLRDAGDALH